MKKTLIIAATVLSIYPALVAAEIAAVSVFAVRGDVVVQSN